MEISSALPTESPDCSLLSKSPGSSLPFTPTRGDGQPWNSPETSVNYTPDCSSSAANPPPISMSSVGANKQKLGNDTQFIQTPEVDSSCSVPRARGQPLNPQTKSKRGEKVPKGQPRACRENRPPAKRCLRKEQEMDSRDASQPPQHCIPMFEFQDLDSPEKDISDVLMEISSTLPPESSDQLICSSSLLSKFPESFLPTTPRRGERQPWDTPEASVNSTPDCRSLAAIPSPISVSPVGANEDLGDNRHLSQTPEVQELGNNRHFSQTPEVDSSLSIQRSTSGLRNTTTKSKGRQKCPKGQPRTSTEKKPPVKRRCRKDQEMEESSDQLIRSSSLLSESPEILPTTPMRGEEQPWDTPEACVNSTPDFRSLAAIPPPISLSPVGAEEQTPEVDSSCSIPKARGPPLNAQTKASGRQKCPKGQPRTRRVNRTPAKCRRRKDQEIEGSDANSPPQCGRPNFESPELDSPEKDISDFMTEISSALPTESSQPLLRSSSLLRKPPESSLPTPSTRGDGQPWNTPEASVNSTPDCRSLAAISSTISVFPDGAEEQELGNNRHFSQTPEVDSSLSIQRSTSGLRNTTTKAKGRQKCPQGQPRTCTEKKPSAKRRRRKDQEKEESSDQLIRSSSLLSKSPESFLPTTPTRGEEQPWDTPEASVNSTPDCRSLAAIPPPISLSPVGAEEQTPEVDSSLSIQRSTSGLRNSTTKAKGRQKCPKGQPLTCTEKKPLAKRRRRKDQEIEEPSDQLIRSSSLLSESPESFLPTTLTRGEGQPWDTPEDSVNSTTDCRSLAAIPPPISLSPVGTKEQTPEVDSSLSIQRSTSGLRNTTTKAKGRQKCPKGQPRTCTEKKPPVKRRRRKDQEMESSDANSPPQGGRPMFESQELESPERDIFDFLDEISITPISLSPVGTKEQTPEVDSSLSIQQSTSGLKNTTTKAKGRQKCPKGQPQTCTEKKPPVKRRRRKDQEMESSDANSPPQGARPMFESQELDSPERDIFDFLDEISILRPISLSPVGTKEQTPEVDSSLSIQQSTSGLRNTMTKAKGRQKCPKGQPQTCTEKKPPVKRRRRKDQEMESSDANCPAQGAKPMFESQELDSPERDIFDFLDEISIPPPISLSPVGTKEQTPEVDSSLSIQRSTSGLKNTTTKAKGRQKCPKGQPQTCTEKKPPVKRRRRKDQEMESSDANSPAQGGRPMFESQELDSPERDIFDFLDEISILRPISLSPVGTKEQTPEVDSSLSIQQSTSGLKNTTTKAKGRQKCPKGQPQTCTEKEPPAKRRRIKDQEMESSDANSPAQGARPMFESQELESPERDIFDFLNEISILRPISLSHVGTKKQTAKVDSSFVIPKANGRSLTAQINAKGRQKCPKGQPRTRTEKRPPAKPRRKKDQEISIPPPISSPHVGANEQTPEVDSSCIIPKADGRPSTAQSKAKGQQKYPKGLPRSCTEKRPPAKPRRKKDQEISIPPPISSSHVGANEQTPEVDSSCIIPKANSRPSTAQSKAKGRQKCPKGQPRTRTEKRPPAKPRRRKDQEISIPPPISSPHVGANEQTPEVDSSCIIPKANGRPSTAQSKAKGRQKCPKGQPRTRTEKGPPAKPRRRKDQEISIPPPISSSHIGANEQTPEVDSSCVIPKANGPPPNAQSKAKGRQKIPKGQPRTCTEKRLPGKRRRRKDQEKEVNDAKGQCGSPIFKSQDLDSPEKDISDLLLEISSTLPTELSDQPTLSVSPVGDKEQELGNETLFNQTPYLETCSTPKARSRPLNARSTAKRRQKGPKAQPRTCSENNKRRRSRKRQELDGRDANSQSPQRCRPRFELHEVESPEKVNLHLDESSMSSDLSIELSDYEEQLASLHTLDEEEEEEEELPSLLMQKKPPSITVGVFVWCKFRNFPFWPAVVRSMNRRMKKASVVFIDGPLMDKICRGLTVSLKTMKPFDCEEGSQFVCNAKEKYDASIKWSLDMISDYRMRIACEHFTGSFIEYIHHDMSYPVRRTFLQGSGETPTISSDLMKLEEFQDHEGRSAEETQEEVKRQSKRRLPDRTRAAYNRANEKLVYYIVNRRMVEKRLLAVISGQQRSTWLHSFLNINQNRKMPVPTYLQDDNHVEKVYRYLKEVFDTAPVTAPCLANVNCVNFIEQVRFVLDVLLPEAVIYALAGVHDVSIATAEDKFLRGRQISNREREEFEWLIEQEMKRRSRLQNLEVTSPLTCTIID